MEFRVQAVIWHRGKESAMKVQVQKIASLISVPKLATWSSHQEPLDVMITAVRIGDETKVGNYCILLLV